MGCALHTTFRYVMENMGNLKFTICVGPVEGRSLTPAWHFVLCRVVYLLEKNLWTVGC